jgi:formiminotetrahydrofolate cyclodeaminase
MLTRKNVNEFLDDTASNSPAPGGGSVAALAAALGAALTSMVCRLTIGKKKYAEVQMDMELVVARSEELRSRATMLIIEDTQAFDQVMAAFSMPKETDEQRAARSETIQQATREAAIVPLKVMELCRSAMPLVKTVAEKGNPNSLSDAGVAALMLMAACEGAALNVKINVATLSDQYYVNETRARADAILSSVALAGREILDRVHSQIGGS